MLMKRETTVARKIPARDPLGLLRHMTSELDRVFERGDWPTFRWAFQRTPLLEGTPFTPAIDVFEKDNRLFTKVDLPGMNKEDVKVEMIDGYLVISGQRKSEVEEKKDDFYRCERGYGSFYREVPLPEGVTLEDVQATFADGVLQVSVPLPTTPKAETRKVEIKDAEKPTKAA
jgi:HSP20 family protein